MPFIVSEIGCIKRIFNERVFLLLNKRATKILKSIPFSVLFGFYLALSNEPSVKRIIVVVGPVPINTLMINLNANCKLV